MRSILKSVQSQALSLASYQKPTKRILGSCQQFHNWIDIRGGRETITDMHNLYLEAASHFLHETQGIYFSATKGGVNNTVLYVDIPSDKNRRYILCIYNSDRKSSMAEFEHAVLSELNKMNLNFDVPNHLKTIKSKDKTATKLSNGAQACMSICIPGVSPRNLYLEKLGAAAGELVSALAKVRIPFECPNRPLYDFYKIHHSITKELFFEVMSGNELDSIRPSANFIQDEVRQVEELIQKLQSYNLPFQLVHGDLHYDNALVENGAITGLIDFEFCKMDWRAMDLGIMLARYAVDKDPMSKLEEYMKGFASKITFTDVEIQAVPDLIKLRTLSNIVFFVGKFLASEYSYDQLRSRVVSYRRRLAWIENHRSAIITILHQSFRR